MRSEFDHRHDRTVREEIEVFRRKAEEFLAGEILEDEFRPFRVKHGIYGQRQPGVQMARCKVPGGLLTSQQVEQLARNATACHWSGIARDEVFDVRPYARKVAYAFLRQDLTGNLPRKSKIAFDGCTGQDCVAGAINDIGLRAVVREGRRGFRMVIGGGLGPLPTEAQLLDEFVSEERLLNRCEAVVRVFNQYGDRANRNKARLKFVLRERGMEWLKEHIEVGDGALLPVLDEGCTGEPEYDAWVETNVEHQQQAGYAAVTERVDQGNLTGADRRRGHLPGRVHVQPGTDQDHGPGSGARRHAEPVRRSPGRAPFHQGQRVPERLQPALDSGPRFLRQRAQDRWEGGALPPNAAGRRLRRAGADAVRPGRAVDSGAPRARGGDTRAGPLHRQPPAGLFPESYQDWGDDEAYSLEPGRGECA